ncbi:MAG: TIM barrel protein [Elusimicrobia bacterium]|nr:TIM barrel protein [Elusimicrobiota bacterium]
MKIGLHVGIRQGPLAALNRARELGLEAMQVLPYRRLPAREEAADGFRWEAPDPEEAAAFRAARAAGGPRLAAHVRYLPFLAGADDIRREASVVLLSRELRFSTLLGAEQLVLHLGAYSPGSSPAEGLRHFVDGAVEALRRAGGGPPLVVENVPGGGRRMGGTLEELAAFRELLAARGVASLVCLDTAHAWAAGYDVATAEGMGAFLDRAAGLFGAPALALFHLNDTVAPRGSHRENHCHWGEGLLGDAGLKVLLSRSELAGAAGILEMPPGKDEASLAYVRSRS